MGKAVLICRLAARDIRHRRAHAVLMLLAITAATAVLSLALALHGVTARPYQQTRAATHGPDVVAQLGGPRGWCISLAVLLSSSACRRSALWPRKRAHSSARGE